MKARLWLRLLVLLLPLMGQPWPAEAEVLNRALGVTTGNVKVMQLCLQAIGHDPGPIDGLWGPRTQMAFTQWLLRSGLPEHVRGDAVVQHFTRRCRTAMLKDARQPSRSFQEPNRHDHETKPHVIQDLQQRMQELDRQAGRPDHGSVPTNALISKKDTQKLFGMSKQVWNQNVLGAVQLGVAQKHSGANGTLGIVIQSPQGWKMRVTPTYDATDRAPSRIHLAVVYPRVIGAALSNDLLQQAADAVNQALAPEYTARLAQHRRPYGLEVNVFIEQATGFYPQY